MTVPAPSTTFGATGAQASLTAGGSAGPTVTISGASLALVSSTLDVSGVPGFALQVTGTVALTAVTGATLTGSGWSADYDTVGNIGPVVVSTGTGGSVILTLTQPAGTTGAWTSVSGPATLAVGSLGSIQGTFAVTAGTSSLTIAATGVSAAITAGTSGAAIQVSGASGSITLTTAGASGSASGQVLLTGASPLTFSATGSVSFSTTTPSFTIAATGTLQIGGLVGLSGAMAFTAGTGSIGLSITSTPAGGSQISLAVQVNPDGTFAANGQVALALPSLLSGVSLGGPVTLQVNTSSLPVMVGGTTIPAATGGGIQFSITSGPPGSAVALAVLITPTGKFAAAGSDRGRDTLGGRPVAERAALDPGQHQ